MRQSVRVLMYHRVAPGDAAAATLPALVSATAAVFDRQIGHLARHYTVISPADVLDAMSAGRPLPSRPVVVTFDDAYTDFRTVAWPILRQHGVPATLFVPTGFPDSGRCFWWDRLGYAFRGFTGHTLERSPIGPISLADSASRRRHLRRIKDALVHSPHDDAMAWVDEICRNTGYDESADSGVLGWEDLRDLAEQGVTLGAHTRNHPVLTQVSEEAAHAEIRDSCEDIRRETGTRPAILSYPAGFHDDAIVRLARQEGIQLAFTCMRGLNRFPFKEPLRLRRLDVTMRTSALVFQARLLNGVSRLDAWQNRIRMGARRTAGLRLGKTGLRA